MRQHCESRGRWEPLPKIADEYKSKWDKLDFPGGTVDKNVPANAGDMGSVPGSGRFPMLESN